MLSGKIFRTRSQLTSIQYVDVMPQSPTSATTSVRRSPAAVNLDMSADKRAGEIEGWYTWNDCIRAVGTGPGPGGAGGVKIIAGAGAGAVIV